MDHNFGKEKASLFNILGGMNYDAKNTLRNADKASIAVAKRKQEVLETGARQGRKKKAYIPHEREARGEEAYDPGGEDL